MLVLLQGIMLLLLISMYVSMEHPTMFVNTVAGSPPFCKVYKFGFERVYHVFCYMLAILC